MEEHTESGWDESVPSQTGAWPSGGAGGSEGRYGAASCRRKERTPERCRTESRREACGTDESGPTSIVARRVAEIGVVVAG